MKKYAMLVLACAFMFSVATIAQEQNPPQGKKGERKEFRQNERSQLSAEKRAERMAKVLELSNAEKVKVQALFEKQDAKRLEHQAAVKKVIAEQKDQFEANRKAQDAELEKIIGKEKFKLLETRRAELQDKMKARRDGKQKHQAGKRNQNREFNPAKGPQVSAPIRADKMAKEFVLTDSEKSKVQALFEKQAVIREQHQSEVIKIREEQMTKFESERKAQDAELEKIIGKDKFLKMETKRDELQAKKNERRFENQKLHQRRGQMNDHQQAKKPQITAKERAERMAKQLELTENEKAQVQALFEKQEAKHDQYREEVKKLKAEQKSKFASERKAQVAELEKIIGKEKAMKLETMRAQRQEKMNQKRMQSPNDSTFRGQRGPREGKRMNEAK